MSTLESIAGKGLEKASVNAALAQNFLAAIFKDALVVGMHPRLKEDSVELEASLTKICARNKCLACS